MKSNRCVFEQLETRQLLSAVPTPFVFQGTAVNGKGAVADRILMTVQQTPTGFTDKVILTDSGGNVTNLTMTMKAGGQFSDTVGNLTLAGRMNPADTQITGSWTLKGPHGGTAGTLTLNVVPTPNPTLPTTNQTTTITYFAGTDTNERHQTSNVTIEVIDTNGVLTGEVFVHNYNDQFVPIPFNISKTGTVSFTFSLTDQTNIVQGKLSADGKTFTGSWTSINTNGTNGFGTVTARAI